MRLARPAALVALVLGALLSAAAPAPAGGPTSVLLVSPSTGRTEALHATDAAYAALQAALNPEPASTMTWPRLTPPDVGGDEIVVTWMIHDVQPWRVDRITLDGGWLPQWIHTIQSDGGAPVDLGAAGVWHRPEDQQRLTQLLRDLGLTGQRPPEDPAAVNVTTAAAPATPPDDGGTAAATWAAPAVAGGILVGVLLGVTSDRWLRRRRAREDDGGRWQLVDVPGPPM